MKFNNVRIAGFAYENPPLFLKSEELESLLAPVYQRLKLPEGRLELQTGIKSRGFWEKGTRPSSIASLSAKKLLKEMAIKTDQIDLLIHASVCRDFLEPATASNVHRELNLGASTQIFDLSNACLGVLNSFVMAGGMIEAGLIKTALIVSGENSGPLIDQTINFLNNNLNLTRQTVKKYIANLTIGSGSVAFLLTHKDYLNSSHELRTSSVLTDSQANLLCQGSGNTESLMMETESEELLHAGIKLATTNFEIFLKEAGKNRSDFSKVLTHQVGVAHRDLLYKTLELNLEKDFSTYPTYGNTGTVALPLTLIRSHEEKFINQGDRIAMLGIGSGLSSLMLEVLW